MNDNAPKRRWLRFSLIGLLWLTTMTGVALGIAVAPSGRDEFLASLFLIVSLVGAFMAVRIVR
jgi:hypothetical protein